jgi:hypothetical protein
MRDLGHPASCHDGAVGFDTFSVTGYASKGWAVTRHPILREPLSARMVVRVGPRADELQGGRRFHWMLREVVERVLHFH